MEEFCKYKKVYNDEQEKIIAAEFQKLRGHHYLDQTAGTLYSEIQIQNVLTDLQSNFYCNPHGSNAISQNTEDAIDVLRFRILKHFNTNPEEYSVIFTSSATSALKLVGENFDFKNATDCSGTFCYLEDNHTSVLGLRSYAKNPLPLCVDKAFTIFSNHLKYKKSKSYESDNCSLFVYPALSNFCGTKYPLTWIQSVHNGILNEFTEKPTKNWFVLLDAASFVSSNHLDLSVYKPDFIPISFYKIFGYPTGLGALIVKNTSAHVLKKRYFGGGAVSMVLALENVTVPRNDLYSRFEDGSPPFLSILALKHGFKTFERFQLTMERISKHTFELASYLFRTLITLHHSNGQRVVQIYHDTVFANSRHQGGIVNFNLLRSNGEYVGYAEVIQMASLYNIHLRAGCSCNPGACQRHLGLTSYQVKEHFKAGHVCGDQRDLVCGTPTGSIRVSFGYMSSKEDADAILAMIEQCFVVKPIVRKFPENWLMMVGNYRNNFVIDEFADEANVDLNRREGFHMIALKCNDKNVSSRNNTNLIKSTHGTLENIMIYPIKSCAPYIPASNWEITKYGLKYDRKWMIINRNGTCVTQKHDVNLCLIKPDLDVKRNTLSLTFKGENSIAIPLDDPNRKPFKCESKICRDRVIGIDCGDLVANWLSKYLNASGLRLIEQASNDDNASRVDRKGEKVNLSFANQSQYLLINIASVKWLKDQVNDENFDESISSMVLRFRPNFVVDLHEPFLENKIDTLTIDGITFKMSGNCTRCQMVCINQFNGEKTKEPLITLSREFRGTVQFGIYLLNETSTIENSIRKGSHVRISKKQLLKEAEENC